MTLLIIYSQTIEYEVCKYSETDVYDSNDVHLDIQSALQYARRTEIPVHDVRPFVHIVQH